MNTKKIRHSYAEHALIYLETLPTIEAFKPRKEDKIVVSKEIIKRLEHHRTRTKVGPQALLRGKRGSMPKGLNSSFIYNLLAGKIKIAEKEYIDYILTQWEELPGWQEQRRARRKKREA